MSVVEGKCALFKEFADVFIGVSAPNIVSKEMVKLMAKDAIVSVDERNTEYIPLMAFGERNGKTVAAAVAEAARNSGVFGLSRRGVCLLDCGFWFAGSGIFLCDGAANGRR